MKETLYEQLSALVDDELTSTEQALLLRRLATDAGLRQRLARYQLVSDALQNHLPPRLDSDFQARVHAALEDEPAVQAGPARLAALFRPVAGLAVAASVAVVAVLSLQSIRQEDPAAVAPVAIAPVPENYIRAGNTPPAAANGVEQVLDVYIVNHNEYAVNRGMQGMLPYVRLVGQDMHVESRD